MPVVKDPKTGQFTSGGGSGGPSGPMSSKNSAGVRYSRDKAKKEKDPWKQPGKETYRMYDPRSGQAKVLKADNHKQAQERFAAYVTSRKS